MFGEGSLESIFLPTAIAGEAGGGKTFLLLLSSVEGGMLRVCPQDFYQRPFLAPGEPSSSSWQIKNHALSQA